MKKFSQYLYPAILAILSLTVWISRSYLAPEAARQTAPPNPEPALGSQGEAQATPRANPQPGFQNSTQADPQTTAANLAAMSEILAKYARPDQPVDDLLKQLSLSKQDPFITDEHNPVLGNLQVVRTGNPLPGTRQFKAEYLADDGKAPLIYQMSFAIQPGKDVLSEAESQVRKSFPTLGEPRKRDADFIEWELDDNYVVQIKVLSSHDLDDGAPHTDADVGSVRMRVGMKQDN